MKMVITLAALCGLVAACSTAPPPVSDGSAAPPAIVGDALPQPTAWRAVLVAGDDKEPAFDNAVDAMARRLGQFGVPSASITILKANGQDEEAATKANIVGAFAGLAPAPSEGCFVFITSHGGPGSGLFMKRARAFLEPADLDRLLRGPCQSRPTVVIASGCFSGSFAEGQAMPAPNRVILTAARDDRPSFGCNADRTFTVFDQCVLDNLARGTLWSSIMADARACVVANERALAVEAPSQPQMSIGAEVGALLAFSR